MYTTANIANYRAGNRLRDIERSYYAVKSNLPSSVRNKRGALAHCVVPDILFAYETEKLIRFRNCESIF